MNLKCSDCNGFLHRREARNTTSRGKCRCGGEWQELRYWRTHDGRCIYRDDYAGLWTFSIMDGLYRDDRGKWRIDSSKIILKQVSKTYDNGYTISEEVAEAVPDTVGVGAGFWTYDSGAE